MALSAPGLADGVQDKKEKKQRTYRLWGHVKDSFTKVGIPDVKVTLMHADSTVVDTFVVRCNWSDTWNKDYWYYFDRPATADRFIIKAEHPDYETCFVDYAVRHVGRNTYFDAPWHFMKRRTRRESLDAQLDEVVVKGSRVKLTYKGDTLVFDAAAFKLPEGSMLDALIRQLPGVQLSDDGVITVNGRKVDYLTLNGKNFFKGDNKVMLDNLPYYTVSNIKVHEKRTEKSEYMGRNIEEPDYVMDVNLKREYSKSYVANAEVGGATDDRWLARGFGSRIRDHSNISAYVNLNNINETRNPSGSGDWTPDNAPVGRRTTKAAGFNMEIDDEDKRYEDYVSVQFSHTIYDNVTSRQATQYLADGEAYSLTDNVTRNRRHNMQARNLFLIKKPVWFRATTEVWVGGYRQDSRQRSAALGMETGRYGEAEEALDTIFRETPPQELLPWLANRVVETSHNVQDNFGAYQRLELNKRLPWGDNIEFEANGRYDQYDTKYFNDSRLDYFNSATPADYRNTYTSQPSKTYRWEARGEYYLNFLSGWTWRVYTLFNQQNGNDTEDRYRLERLQGWQNGMQPLGAYPEDPELLSMAWSAYDSSHRNRMTRNSQSGLHFYYDKRRDSSSTFLRFHLPLYVRSEKLAYRQGVVDTCVNRSRTFLNGNINMNVAWDGWRQRLWANFWHAVILPDLYNNIDLRDDRNPLTVNLGNSALKTEHSYRVNGQYSYNSRNRRLGTWLLLNWEYHTNPVLQGYSYDRTTGVYTYRKENGDHRWNGDVSGGMRMDLDRDRRWSVQVTGGYSPSGGQMFRLAEGAEKAGLYAVRSKAGNFDVRLQYNKETLYAAINCNMYNSSTRYDTPVPSRSGVTVWRLVYHQQYTIPVLELQLATQLGWYRYSSTVEGTPTQDNVVWNVFLSRALLKDKSLLLKLNAFDILNSVSHYNYWNSDNTFNVQKYERLGRYVMLSLAWTFKAKQKK